MVNMNGTGGGSNGLANTAALLGNGGIFQNGVSSNPNGNGTVANAVERAGNYATLPHPHHHLQNIHVTEADTITQHWSRDNLLAASYDVNLSTFANNSNGNTGSAVDRNGPKSGVGVHSRENTLGRDVHHITDYGMRSSCTAENLRSPSVAGTHGRIDDDIDLNTDYAESDVMLGERAGTGTN